MVLSCTAPSLIFLQPAYGLRTRMLSFRALLCRLSGTLERRKILPCCGRGAHRMLVLGVLMVYASWFFKRRRALIRWLVLISQLLGRAFPTTALHRRTDHFRLSFDGKFMTSLCAANGLAYSPTSVIAATEIYTNCRFCVVPFHTSLYFSILLSIRDTSPVTLRCWSATGILIRGGDRRIYFAESIYVSVTISTDNLSSSVVSPPVRHSLEGLLR